MWQPNPAAASAAAIYLALYLYRWRVVRRSSGTYAAGVGRLTCFCVAVMAFVVALSPPIDTLAERSATGHMIQHVLLIDVVPVMAILGFTKVLLRPIARAALKLEHAAGPLAHPGFAVFLYAGVLWAWHAPALYDLSLRNDGWHLIEHLSFMFAGGLYWWHLISPIRNRFRFGGIAPIVYMAGTKLLAGALGMALTFMPKVLYDYSAATGIWGLDRLEDQNIAGTVMAIEQGVVMGIALVVLFFRMLAETEREQLKRERLQVENS